MQTLAFIDLLGFGRMVGNNFSRSKIILDDFYNITFRIIKDRDEVQGHLFSDSLLAYSSDPAILVNVITEIYRECLKKNDTYDFDLSKHFLLPCPSYLFVLPEIIDNSPTFHYSRRHYGNYNFANFHVHFVDFDKEKSSP